MLDLKLRTAREVARHPGHKVPEHGAVIARVSDIRRRTPIVGPGRSSDPLEKRIGSILHAAGCGAGRFVRTCEGQAPCSQCALLITPSSLNFGRPTLGSAAGVTAVARSGKLDPLCVSSWRAHPRVSRSLGTAERVVEVGGIQKSHVTVALSPRTVWWLLPDKTVVRQSTSDGMTGDTRHRSIVVSESPFRSAGRVGRSMLTISRSTAPSPRRAR